MQELLDPFYCSYRCADARPFYLVAPSHLTHQRRALAVLGLTDEVAKLGVPVAGGASAAHGLGACQVGDAHAPALRRLLRRAFLRTRATNGRSC